MLGQDQPTPSVQPLHSCRCVVDVVVDGSEDASREYRRRLVRLGATVLKKVDGTATHLIFKSGREQVYNSAKKRGVHIVGTTWVVQCEESGERVEESFFTKYVKPPTPGKVDRRDSHAARPLPKSNSPIMGSSQVFPETSRASLGLVSNTFSRKDRGLNATPKASGSDDPRTSPSDVSLSAGAQGTEEVPSVEALAMATAVEQRTPQEGGTADERDAPHGTAQPTPQPTAEEPAPPVAQPAPQSPAAAEAETAPQARAAAEAVTSPQAHAAPEAEPVDSTQPDEAVAEAEAPAAAYVLPAKHKLQPRAGAPGNATGDAGAMDDDVDLKSIKSMREFLLRNSQPLPKLSNLRTMRAACQSFCELRQRKIGSPPQPRRDAAISSTILGKPSPPCDDDDAGDSTAAAENSAHKVKPPAAAVDGDEVRALDAGAPAAAPDVSGRKRKGSAPPEPKQLTEDTNAVDSGVLPAKRKPKRKPPRRHSRADSREQAAEDGPGGGQGAVEPQEKPPHAESKRTRSKSTHAGARTSATATDAAPQVESTDANSKRAKRLSDGGAGNDRKRQALALSTGADANAAGVRKAGQPSKAGVPAKEAHGKAAAQRPRGARKSEGAETASATKRSADQKHAPRQIATSLSNDLGALEVVLPVVAQLGGSALPSCEAETPGPEVSHLITTAQPKRTVKVLFALARGIPVVSAEWVLQSCTAERWLPHNKFVALPRVRYAGEQLRGMKIYVGGGTKLSVALLEELVTAAGGEAVRKDKAAGGFQVGGKQLEHVQPLAEDELIDIVVGTARPPKGVQPGKDKIAAAPGSSNDLDAASDAAQAPQIAREEESPQPTGGFANGDGSDDKDANSESEEF